MCVSMLSSSMQDRFIFVCPTALVHLYHEKTSYEPEKIQDALRTRNEHARADMTRMMLFSLSATRAPEKLLETTECAPEYNMMDLPYVDLNDEYEQGTYIWLRMLKTKPTRPCDGMQDNLNECNVVGRKYTMGRRLESNQSKAMQSSKRMMERRTMIEGAEGGQCNACGRKRQTRQDNSRIKQPFFFWYLQDAREGVAKVR